MAGEKKPREWGDGGGDERSHVVVDISFAAGVIVCRCREYVSGITPDLLADSWVAHGGNVLRMANAVERTGSSPAAAAEHRAVRAVAAIGMLGKRCECSADSDIRDCPNYIEGDEEDPSDT